MELVEQHASYGRRERAIEQLFNRLAGNPVHKLAALRQADSAAADSG